MNFLIKWLLPMIEATGVTALVAELQNWHDTHPDTYKQFLTAFYPIVDVQLESYFTKLGKKVPLEIVEKVKGAIEQSAATNSLVLPNLDND